MKNLYLFAGILMSIAFSLNADDYSISVEEYNEIKSKVASLNKDELISREAELKNTISNLETEQLNTQDPFKLRTTRQSLGKLLALSLIHI